MRNKLKIFDVALSFAGEDRSYVEKVAYILREMGLSVFYDKYEAVTLWGKDLYVHLHEIYYKRAKYTIMFISKHYAKKLWSNHERKSAQARAFSERKEYILPVRFDKTKIPGILPTVGYVDLKNITPKKLAEMIKLKIGPIKRTEFFPEKPDRLCAYFGKISKATREKIHTLAESFYKMLKLMTPFERRILTMAVRHTCPAGPPENVHLDLEYFGRLVSLSRAEIISLFSRLDCLGIISKIYKTDNYKSKDRMKNVKEIIEIKYNPLLQGYGQNATYIMGAIFECIFNNACPTCGMEAIERGDLSILGTLTGFLEKHKLRRRRKRFKKVRTNEKK